MGKNGLVSLLCGEGKGKTSAAIGQAIRAAGSGKLVVIIQFLKGKDTGDYDMIRNFEPDIKLFSFEKTSESFRDLSPEHQQEEMENIRTGMNFAKKVLTAGECDLLVLDEFAGLVDTGIITVDEFAEVLKHKPEETEIIITGIRVSDSIKMLVDEITTFTTEKFQVNK